MNFWLQHLPECSGRSVHKLSSFLYVMAQNIAKYQYISAVHHKMTGKSMAKHIEACSSGRSILGRFTAHSKACLHGVNNFPLFFASSSYNFWDNGTSGFYLPLVLV